MSHTLFALPWHELLLPKPSWAEKILRPLIIYLVLLLVFRFSSKRALAQATLFDFLIILLISNVVQNAIIGDDSSILGAIAGALTLVFLSDALNRLSSRSKEARHILEGMPVLLIRDGKVDDTAMKQQAVSRNDLFSAIRKTGMTRIEDVGFAILELDGTISVMRVDEDTRPHTCLPVEIVGRESEEEETP